MVLPPYNEQQSAERGSRSCSACTLGTKKLFPKKAAANHSVPNQTAAAINGG
jgi:hypothetical protein